MTLLWLGQQEFRINCKTMLHRLSFRCEVEELSLSCSLEINWKLRKTSPFPVGLYKVEFLLEIKWIFKPLLKIL